MKYPMFTHAPGFEDASAWKERRVISGEETASVRRTQDWFQSREAFIRHGEQHEERKFRLGKYLAGYLKPLAARSVLSLGAGECYHEYALKTAAPGIKIHATDFDPFVARRVAELLPELDAYEVVDIKKDDFARFRGRYDTILLISVEYVFSDDEMVDFFRRVSAAGASHLIIISSSYISNSSVIRQMYYSILAPLSYLKRLLLGRELRTDRGRFHGWARSKGEFVRLMKLAGTLQLREVVTGEPFGPAQALLYIVPAGTANPAAGKEVG